MSSREDLLDPAPAAAPAPPEPSAQPAPAAEPAAAGPEPRVWTLAGEEPPPDVVRLVLRDGSAGDLNELARIPRGSRGADHGWWWVARGQAPVTDAGWCWPGAVGGPRTRLELVQHFPVLTYACDDLAKSLAVALPQDGEWYQIGVTASGVPVWGQHDDDHEDGYDLAVADDKEGLR
jgi:hypothetical protein